MTPSYETLLFYSPRFMSSFEEQASACLARTLTPPWSLRAEPEPLYIPYPDGEGKYTPSLLIENKATGRKQAVAIISDLSISIRNMVRWQHVQDTLSKTGMGFVIIVHGGAHERDKGCGRLHAYGLNAITAGSHTDAASGIIRQLALRNASPASSDHASSSG